MRDAEKRIGRPLLALVVAAVTVPALIVLGAPLGFYEPLGIAFIAAITFKWWQMGMGLLYAAGVCWPILLPRVKDLDPTGPPTGGAGFAVYAGCVGLLMLCWLLGRGLRLLWRAGQVPT